jgi:hypothetical protein
VHVIAAVFANELGDVIGALIARGGPYGTGSI